MRVAAPKFVDREQVIQYLRANLDDMQLQLVRQVSDRIPGYEPSRVDQKQLEEAIYNTLRSVLGYLLDSSVRGADREEMARSLGAARALQGVPIDAMLKSFAIGERMFADELVKHIGPASIDEIRHELNELSEAFDWLQSIAVSAYHDAQDEVLLQHHGRTRDLISLLLLGDAHPYLATQQARLIGLDVEHACQVVAVASGGNDARSTTGVQYRAFDALSSAVDGRIVSTTVNGYELYLVPGVVPATALAALRRWIDRVPDPCYVTLGTEVPNLHLADRSARQAMTAMDVVRHRQLAGSIHTFDQLLLEVLLFTNNDLADRMHELYRKPMLGQEHLIETVLAYLDSNLSIRNTAQTLHVHPNTVAYRLSRIESLIGLNPRDARSLVKLALAMGA